MRILVTGANGFVGRQLTALLVEQGHRVTAAVRREGAALPAGIGEIRAIGDIGPDTDWNRVLDGIDAVIHLAARVHVMRETAPDSLARFRRVNVLGTQHLARAAAQAGAGHFVYLSSVKVHGETSPEGAPFTEAMAPAPEDAYGISKWEAEQALAKIAAETGLGVTVFRPPLVYGPGVRANFERLVEAVRRGIPLPFGAVQNRRSLVYVGNLADAVATSLSRAEAIGQTFLVSDGPAVSTAELIRSIAEALQCKPRLASIPPALLKLTGALTGKEAEIGRLLGDLAVNDALLRNRLGWRPPYSLREGLAATVLKTPWPERLGGMHRI
ncbi:UDP-glucose 4-epimerase family protein [Methylococcus geothermalis]|uniref:NAD-dependent epimerase/dehydratase family protein n=1 Tax=Methylococcus geothermalis TaxID=2681310 RepID=A0A858QB46_9GAMM|nr:SDR family oxidoreductase [Methylococcus geothermalis]QJD31137.1 NAD-dependent epimerase/dehydratase family protein [Methylococcus geothermalis]